MDDTENCLFMLFEVIPLMLILLLILALPFIAIGYGIWLLFQ